MDASKKSQVQQLLTEKLVQKKKRSARKSIKKRKTSVTVNSSISTPPIQNTPDYHLLSTWGLPVQLTKWYASKGITELFPWQADCLRIGKVLEGENLVYSAPTSAGKTMVAEIIMFKHLLERKKKAMMIMPFISITREKMLTLKQLLRRVSIRVDAFAGNTNPKGGLARVDVAVCTIEKANSMINRLIEDGKLQTIGIIVVDELHMIGDASRGYLLELLLTKILFLNGKYNYGIQIVGMSATLPNLSFIAKWLKSQLYITDFRPVPLHERVVFGDVIYDVKDMREVKRIDYKEIGVSSEEKSVFFAIETITEGNGVLIFCQTKAICEKLSKDIATDIYKLGSSRDVLSSRAKEVGEQLREICRVNYEKILEVLEQLRRSPAGLDLVLEKTVKFGVAYHHAGLTIDERNIIESAFRHGTIKVLCATSTLSAGVNLPARRVIVRTPYDFRGSLIDILTYNQMIGRAGRKGVDTMGESVLICNVEDRSKVFDFFKAQPRPITSCLVNNTPTGTPDNNGCMTSALKRAVLEIIANGIAQTYDDVYDYMSCTLFSCQSDSLSNQTGNVLANQPGHSLANQPGHLSANQPGHLSANQPSNLLSPNQSGSLTESTLQQVLKYLTENKLLHDIKQQEHNKRTLPTKLGKAVLASAISPDEGLFILEELSKAKKSICLSNDLHLVYEVTPPSVSQTIDINWQHYLQLWSNLDNDLVYVGNLVGVREYHLIEMIRGKFNMGNQLCILKRFYTALALYDLIHEVSLHDVSVKYKLGKGVLQSLQQTASTFAGMITVFCNRLGWTNLEILFEQFQTRLYFGIQRDLIDLMRVTCLTSDTARYLFGRGFDTVAALACSTVSQVELLLMNSGPFRKDPTKHADNSKIVWVAGQCTAMNEKDMAQAIVNEAREIVQKDLGIKIDKWTNSTDSNDTSRTVDDNLKIDRHSELSSMLIHDPSFLDNMENNEFSLLVAKESQNLMQKDPEFDKCSDKSGSGSKSPTEILSFINETHVESMSIKIDIDDFDDIDDMIYGEITDPDDLKCSEPQIQSTSSAKDDKILSEINNKPMISSASNSMKKDTNFASSSMKKDINFASSPIKKEFIEKPTFNLSISSYGNIEKHEEKSYEDMEYSHLERTPSLESLESFDEPNDLNNSLVKPTKFKEIKCGDFVKKMFVNSKGQQLEIFINKWIRSSCFSIIFSLEKVENKERIIGLKIKRIQKGNEKIKKEDEEDKKEESDKSKMDLKLNNLVLKSLAVCFDGESYVYYVCSEEILEDIKKRLSNILNKNPQILTFNVKQTYQVFENFFQIDQDVLMNEINWFDSRIAHWIFDPESRKPQKVGELVKKYIPHYSYLLPMQADVVNEQCISTCLLFPLMNELNHRLVENSLYTTFKNVELLSRLVIGQMEINGIGVDKDYADKQQQLLYDAKVQLEAKAFEIAKKRFKLSSPDQVATVLFYDLNLLSYIYKDKELDKEVDSGVGLRTDSGVGLRTDSGVGLRINRKLPKNLKTSKPVLKKLSALSGHPLPEIILNWRKIDHAMKKTIKPMINFCYFNKNLNMYRVNCISDDWSATGRIAIEDPNLIGIDKEFVIKDIINEDTSEKQDLLFTLRRMIIARDNYVLVSADYSQLELRILAHLSGDKKLTKVLNDGGDVFKNIAAGWKSKSFDHVTAEERQQAKHICYGMIYGIGAKSLSDTLDVSEHEAREFMDSFMNKYSQVKEYINKTIDSCRDSHYVETINGRKRFLPNIECHDIGERRHAERQAVNTTIQGSASDLVKLAMITVEKKLLENQSSISAKLVLQMYDELMYEVRQDNFYSFAYLLKKSMESCSKMLTVHLPVNVKFGQNWASMTAFQF